MRSDMAFSVQCTLCAVRERVDAAVFRIIHVYICIVCRSPHRCSSIVHISMRRIVLECSLAPFLRRRRLFLCISRDEWNPNEWSINQKRASE